MGQSGQREDTAASSFRQAGDLYRQGRYEDALNLLEGLDDQLQQTQPVMYARARCLVRQGRSEEAAVLCDALLERFADPRAVELKAIAGGAAVKATTPARMDYARRPARKVSFKPVAIAIVAAAALLAPMIVFAVRERAHTSSAEHSTTPPARAITPAVKRDFAAEPGNNEAAPAMELYKSGYWSKAMAAAASLLQSDPDHPGAREVQRLVNQAREDFLNSHDSVGGNTSVVCLDNPAQSYELYAPPACRPDQTPIIYAFNPAGNGKGPLGSLAPVAARLGWIVAASNNSRNGPWDVIFEAQDAVFRDTAERLDLHPTRRFATGFSGGARAALALAFRYPGAISGVLAMGAGWPVNTDLTPPPNGLNVYILIGNADSNIKGDIPRTEKKLRSARVNCVTVLYNGGHVMPSQDLIDAGCVWLNNCSLQGYY